MRLTETLNFLQNYEMTSTLHTCILASPIALAMETASKRQKAPALPGLFCVYMVCIVGLPVGSRFLPYSRIPVRGLL